MGSTRCVIGLIFNTPDGDYFLRRAVIYTGLKNGGQSMPNAAHLCEEESFNVSPLIPVIGVMDF